MKAREKSILFFILFIVLTIFFNSGSLNAEDRKKIAILKFGANNIPESYAEVVRDILEVHLYKTNAFDIIERNQIDLILKEQGFEGTGCVDSGCAVKIGKLLSVDMVIIGSVNKIAKFTITIKFIDVKGGHVRYADSEIAYVEDAIENAINTLAERSAKKMTLKKPDTVKVLNEPVKEKPKTDEKKDQSLKSTGSTPAGYYLRGIIPGWGQLYSEKFTKSIIFFSGFIISGAVAGYFVYDFKKKRDEYDNLTWDDPRDVHDKKYDETKKAFRTANITIGIFAGIYLINWIDIIFFSKPSEKLNGSIINYKDIYFGFNLNNQKMNEPEISTYCSFRF